MDEEKEYEDAMKNAPWHKENRTTFQEIKTLKPNSFSFRIGGVGSDLKIYYEDAEDLAKQIHELTLKIGDIKTNIQGLKDKMQGVI